MDLTVTVAGLKSLGETVFTIKPGVNVLIGPNGSGKTNVLRSLKFIRDVVIRGAGLAVARGGGPIRIYNRRRKRIDISVVAPYGLRTFNKSPHHYWMVWNFSVAQEGPDAVATIVNEEFQLQAERAGVLQFVLAVDVRRGARTTSNVAMIEPHYVGRDLFSELRRLCPGGKHEAFEAVVEKLQILAREHRRLGDIALLRSLAALDSQINALMNAFGNLAEYEILPEIARESTDQVPEAVMQPNGRNLTEVIHALEKKQFHRLTRAYYSDADTAPVELAEKVPGWFWPRPGRPYYVSSREFDGVLDAITQEMSAAVRGLDKVSVGIDPSNGKRFLQFHAGSDRFYPEEVSDGTIKWLGVLVSVMVPFTRIYLIEEPENFLHPWMQQRLIALMRRRIRRSPSYYVLTTHSATLLNAAELGEVHLVTRDNKGTTVQAAAARDDVVKVLSRSEFGLGDLWVSGALGAVPAGETS